MMVLFRYSSIDDAYVGQCAHMRSLTTQDSRDGPCREALFEGFVLKTVDHTFLANERRAASSTYACAELLWYISGSDDPGMMIDYAPQYDRFCDTVLGRRVAHGAYGARMVEDPAFVHARDEAYHELAAGEHTCTTQMAAVIDVLRRKPSSRQAVLSLWNAGDLVHAMLGDRRDLPCTLGLCFYRREHALHCMVTMRSNDIWLGTPYDVFCFTGIQKLVAWALGVEAGSYCHMVGSMHAYERNWAAVNEVTAKTRSPTEVVHEAPSRPVSSHIIQAIALERSIRSNRADFDTQRVLAEIADTLGPRTLLADAVRCCAYQWLEDRDAVKASIHSPALREGVKARKLD